MCLLLSAAGSRRYVRQDHHATNTVWQIVTRVERHSARQHFRETMFKAITKCSQDVRKALIYVFARRSQGAQGDEDLEEVKTSEKIARCSQGAQDLQGAHQKLGDSVFDKLVKMARSPHSRGVVRTAPNARVIGSRNEQRTHFSILRIFKRADAEPQESGGFASRAHYNRGRPDANWPTNLQCNPKPHKTATCQISCGPIIPGTRIGR